MNTHPELVGLLLIFFSSQLAAQSLPWSVIATSGEQVSSSGGSLEWTLGEIMTETYSQKNFLTQGFQQPATIKVTDIEDNNSSISIYPNPTVQYLFVKVNPAHDWLIELFDLTGKRLLFHNVSTNSIGPIEIDLNGLSSTMYLLSISNQTQGGRSFHKIVKN